MGADLKTDHSYKTKEDKKRTIFGSLALLLVCAVWGSGFPIAKIAMEEANPMALIAMRFVLATVVIFLLSIPRLKKMNIKIFTAGLVLAIPMYLGFFTQFAGLTMTSASNAGFITGMYIIFTPILSAIFLKKKTTLVSVLGIVIATLGLALLSISEGFTFSKGDLLVLLCALMFAIHIILLDIFSKKMDGMLLTLSQLFWVSVIACIVGARYLPEILTYSKNTLLAAVFLGLFATAFAYYVQTTAQKYISPVGTSMILQMEVIFSAVFAYFILGEIMSQRQWMGAALIFVGVLICQLSDIRNLAKQKI